MKNVLVIDVPMTDDGKHLCDECPIWNKERLYCEYNHNMLTDGCPLIERYETGEVLEEVKEELHHIESDNKMLKEVIIRMAMEHTGVVG